MMKKAGIFLTVFVLLLGFCHSQAAYAEAAATPDLDALVAQYEPQPYHGVSLQETAPFDPIAISPQAFSEQISRHKSADETIAFFQRMGLDPLAAGAEYVYHNKHNRSSTRFPLPKGQWSDDELTIVTYAYDESSHDNQAFLFARADGSYRLMDCLTGFGDVQLVSNAEHTALWLVGKTGAAHQTVRWYSVAGQCIALAYLAQGMDADRTDFHVAVKSLADPIVDQSLPPEDRLTILKQVSIIDYTKSNRSEDGVETVFYTQRDVYACLADGAFALLQSERLDGVGLQAVMDYADGEGTMDECLEELQRLQ